MKTNVQLFNTGYAATQMASDQVVEIYRKTVDGLALDSRELRPALLELRNTLREAYCAIQELKTRVKQATDGHRLTQMKETKK